MSSPLRVVMVLCALSRWSSTSSRLPCQRQVVPGQGQAYGRNSQVSSCFLFSLCKNRSEQPEFAYLHGKRTVSATLSMAKLRTPLSGPLQAGHICVASLGWQLLQTKCPLSHWCMGGRT